jgi:DNA-binding NarL/FixJ family response regulator
MTASGLVEIPNVLESARMKLIIAEDHAEMRSQLAAIVAADHTVVGTVGNGSALIDEAERLKPDLVLLDISMPVMSGIVAATILHERMPALRIIFVTQRTEQAYISKALLAGAIGYVLKRRVITDLPQAFHCAQHGGVFISPGLCA